MIRILFKIIGFKLFYQFNWPVMLPINLTLGVTYRCNSRCKTCNIWKKKNNLKELTLEEIEKIFDKFGRDLIYLTITGGEPFLRNDLVNICKIIYDKCHPLMITIPTNSLLGIKVVKDIQEIVDYCSKTRIIVNLSVDDIDERDNKIRGVENHYKKMIIVFNQLKKIKNKNFTLGIHTVISKWNVHRFAEIYGKLTKLKPDSYIAEIAENRVELLNTQNIISPDFIQYQRIVEFLKNKLKIAHYNGFANITKAFRQQYFDMSIRTLQEKKQIIPCFAGWASAQITPDGEVWGCCVKAQSYGNLRKVNYDFAKLWNTKKADKIRSQVKSRDCYCPLANVSYTNMLMNFKTLLKVVLNIL